MDFEQHSAMDMMQRVERIRLCQLRFVFVDNRIRTRVLWHSNPTLSHSTIYLRYMDMLHSHTRCAGMGWAVLCCALRCDTVFFMYMNIHICTKMAEDDDDDALVLLEYHKRAHVY